MRMNLLLLTALLAVAPAETDAAMADRAKLAAESQPYAAYLSLSDVAEADRDALEAVSRVVVCSLSSRSHLPSQLPARVEGTNLLRLDLFALGWEKTWPGVLQAHYPYRRDLSAPYYPLVISAAWFVSRVTDPVETKDAQDLLLYGPEKPKNLDDVLKFWKVQSDQQLFWGYLEGDSGVSLRKARTIENRPSGNRGYAWGTRDFEKLDAKSDPLEQLKPGTGRFDASEWVIGIPKYESGRIGMLNAYVLADAKGNLQAKAPAAIVADHTELRGPEIRNWISCIACHTSGLVDPTLDEYRDYLKRGATISSYDKATKEAIEAYLESDVAGELKRNRELYAAGIEMVCGLKPEAFSTAFVKAVKAYDAPLSIEVAARELGCAAEELKLALAYQSAKGVNLSPRLAALAHEKAVPRDRWEELQYLAAEYVATWKASDNVPAQLKEKPNAP